MLHKHVLYKERKSIRKHKAKNYRSDTKEVIIVEGYMDVLSLHNREVKNVISNSGTALTETQIK